MKTFKQFQEGVVALKVGSKLLPKLMIGIGAGGTLYKASQEYIKKKFRPKEEEKPKDDYYDGGEEQERIEKEIQKKMKDKQDTDKANKKQLKQINNPTGKDNPFSGSGKKIDAETRKRMNAPENQFNSYNPLGEEAPTNSTGPNVPGTGDDSSTVVVKKSSILRRRNYAKGGKNSRKPWLDYLKNKYT